MKCPPGSYMCGCLNVMPAFSHIDCIEAKHMYLFDIYIISPFCYSFSGLLVCSLVGCYVCARS